MGPALLTLLLTLAPGGPAGDKDDIVVLDNGNELLGEIKSMSRGKLRFKTDSAGTLTIEWDEVLRIASEHRFRVERLDGERLVGSFPDPPEDRNLLLLRSDGTQEILPLADIARLTEFDQSAWERLDGYVKAGFSFTKASNVTQYNLGAGFTYFERERSLSLDASAIITDQENEDTAQKADLTASFRRLLSRRWFGVGFLSLNHNTELALDLRSTLGVGPGRYLIQSQSHELAAYAGIAYSYEVPDGESASTSWEGLVGATYDIFITDTPEMIVNLNALLYPGITESDRLRATLNVDFNKEIIEDFFFNITYYLDYDSNPSSDDGETTDYGIITGLSYTF